MEMPWSDTDTGTSPVNKHAAFTFATLAHVRFFSLAILLAFPVVVLAGVVNFYGISILLTPAEKMLKLNRLQAIASVCVGQCWCQGPIYRCYSHG